MKKLGIPTLAVLGLLITSNVASAQVVCAIPLMIVSAMTWQSEHRELTNREAMWCGLVHEQQPAAKVKKVKNKKVARRAKKKH
jgi:hypothetical protein